MTNTPIKFYKEAMGKEILKLPMQKPPKRGMHILLEIF
jgi:hypothetical protein